jgi:hypothetical protein
MEHSVTFNEMIKFAEAGLKGNWDGWSKWQELKIEFSEETIGSWNEIILSKEYSEYRERILVELPEHNADGTSHGPNHFIIQCLRIPYINKLSVRRLMQIAYCIGQFQAVIHTYDQKYVDEFYKMKLDKIETYV